VQHCQRGATATGAAAIDDRRGFLALVVVELARRCRVGGLRSAESGGMVVVEGIAAALLGFRGFRFVEHPA
jgi:hypothetical protein